MLPPIFPRPMRPISIDAGLSASGWQSSWVVAVVVAAVSTRFLAEQTARHEEVLEGLVGLGVEVVDSGDHRGLRGLRERQLHHRVLHGGQAVEQELRVEAGGDR